MANNPETLAQLYGLFLYKKKDIIAIQEKLGIGGVLEGPGNANQSAMHLPLAPLAEPMLEGKTLADSYELLLELIGDLITIQENLNIDGNPILEEALRSNKASTDIPFGELFNLLMYLGEGIIAIQDELDIVGYSNQERAEEAHKNARAYLRKFEEFHGPLEDVPSVILEKFREIGVKKILFTGDGLPLIPNLTPQQLHEIFVKNSAGADQCPCLE